MSSTQESLNEKEKQLKARFLTYKYKLARKIRGWGRQVSQAVRT